MADIVEYDDFRFMPAMLLQNKLMLEASGMGYEAEDEDFEELMAGLSEVSFGHDNIIADALSMEGFWPPTDAQLEKVGTVMELLRDVEKETGVSFQRQVGVAPTNSGLYSVNEDGFIMMDCNALTGDSPNLSTLKNIMLHEAGHMHYQDTHQLSALAMACELTKPLQATYDAYARDKALFYDVVSHGYENVDAFEAALKDAQNDIDTFLEPLSRLPKPIKMLSSDSILNDMYGDGIVANCLQEAIENPENMSFKHVMDIAEAFPFYTEDDMARKRQQDAIINVAEREDVSSIDEQYALQVAFITSRDAKFTITDKDKARIDGLVESALKPLCAQRQDIMDFAQRVSIAAEFRADDFALAHSDNPTMAVFMLQNLEELLKHNDELASLAPEHVNSHPDTSARMARAEVFADMIEKAQKENPEVKALSLLKTGSHTAHYLERKVAKKVQEIGTKSPAR